MIVPDPSYDLNALNLHPSSRSLWVDSYLQEGMLCLAKIIKKMYDKSGMERRDEIG
jgi:hypothetical protein